MKTILEQSVPNDNSAYVFTVTAFGKHFGLAMDSMIDEKAIKLFCEKVEEKLLFELKMKSN